MTPAPGALVGLRRSESGGWVPPDTQLAASADYIFEVVNLEGRIWTKAGGLVKTFDLASFFGLSGANLSDPKIRFDPGSGRWFVAIISYNERRQGDRRAGAQTVDEDRRGQQDRRQRLSEAPEPWYRYIRFGGGWTEEHSRELAP